MPQRLGIIGHPIGHSISPAFQQAALDAIGFNAVYRPFDVPPNEVADFVNALRTPETLGVNVTVPHKETVIPHLDEVDDWAAAAGAVNTIVNRHGRLTGHNTDGAGFLRALQDGAGFAPQGKTALILGAGGSARAVVYALTRAGAARLIIANRTPQRAQNLAQIAAENGIPAQAIPLTDAPQAAADAALIVNCTSLGMLHGPDETASSLTAAEIPPAALVNDLVYNPPETPLLRQAARAGAAVLGGIQMLVYQGAASFEMWTGQPAPVPVMLQAAAAAMRNRQ